MFKKLFGGSEKPAPPPPPQPKKFNEMSKEEMREVQKEFRKKINTEVREVDKQIFRIDMASKKAEEDLKREIKKGDKADKFVKQTYAKQVLQCRTQKQRYMANKAKVQGLQYTLDNFFADIKLAQTMQNTAGIMKAINQCINIKELQVSMAEMQKEMAKMGIIQEMMDDAMEAVNDDVEFDNEQEIDSLIDQMEKGLKEPKQNQFNQNLNQNIQQNHAQEEDDFDAQLAALKN
ncbi:SNF7 family protein (macronuclear) [Tetrahymena thermophila SB210]|uniref:SNF7 family protein n=1 Tax=Tetrahymena thermophila (strain SB210) TaxID=312017 RepID=I7M6U6_TETTS|nr:SNF7 family protein [Tetrahymena thermophila SB210]EAR87283.1 SNF7 family protein [Tetrahymena thermophila SB210]|eukprot:XP_001007528.1 SNF7 family protein [Tetrahymena thermophila SB210]